MNKILPKYMDQGLKAYVILIEDQFGNPPNAAACKKYVKDHKMVIPMLYDAKKVTKIYGGKETNLVTNDDAVIVLKKVGDVTKALEDAIVKELDE